MQTGVVHATPGAVDAHTLMSTHNKLSYGTEICEQCGEQHIGEPNIHGESVCDSCRDARPIGQGRQP